VVASIFLFALISLFYYVPTLILDKFDLSDDNTKRNTRASHRRKFMKLTIFTIFLIYPTVSASVLKLYVCQNVAGTYYLLEDFTIICHDHRWNTYAGANILCIIAYPIGIPALFGYVLYRHRHQLAHPAIRLQYGFLYDAYTLSHWYFELFDMANKLFLTSILAFFPTKSQIPIGMAWCTGFTIYLLLSQPYLRKGDDRLHLTGQTELFLLMLMAYVLIEVDSTIDPTTDILLSLVCIAITVFFICFFLLQATVAIRKILYIRAMKKLKVKQDLWASASEMAEISQISDQGVKPVGEDGQNIEQGDVQLSPMQGHPRPPPPPGDNPEEPIQETNA